jgi:uncharacterized protein (TIGR02588 family)
MKQTLSRQKSEKNQRQRTTLAEWVTFLLSLVVVALIVGLVLHSWMTQSDEPPILKVTGTTEVREVQGQFYVPFTVENLGGETAESVQVISEIEQNGQVVETGEQQIDFLSANEKQEGAFIFTRDPRQGNYNVRVGSYKLP